LVAPFALFGPSGASTRTFGAGEIYTTDGFGQNRDARRGTAMGQYEGRIGSTGSYRIAGMAYATSYHSAGVIRDDDLRSGRSPANPPHQIAGASRRVGADQ